MLFLLFKLDSDRYAIEIDAVASVLPLVKTKKIPHAPAEVAGIFTHRGEAIPLIDLSRLTLGRPARRLLSTRIILVHYAPGDGQSKKLGLIAEEVVETTRRAPEEFVASGIANTDATYLGPVASDSHGLIQWVRTEDLLTNSVRDLLYREIETAESC